METANNGAPVHTKYVRLIFILFFASILTRFIVDKSFYVVANQKFADADALAGFLGNFFAVAGASTFALRSMVSGRVLERFGLGGALLVLPVSLGLAALGSVFVEVGWLVPAAAFWSLAAAKFSDRAFRQSIDRSAVLLLYQPLGGKERARAQTLSEGMISPLAAGVAGALLILVDKLWHAGVTELSYLMLAAVTAWLIAAWALKHNYPRALAAALWRRQLRGGTLALRDPQTLTLLREAAESPHSGAVLYALELLGEAEPDYVRSNLPALLSHPAPEVRANSLQRLEQTDDRSALRLVREIAVAEELPEVRSAAIKALAALDEEEVLDSLDHYLESPVAQVRSGALVGLLRHGSLEGILAAGRQLGDLLRSPRGSERILAAQILGEVGGKNLYRPLLSLLGDRKASVRRAALEASRKVANRRLWPHVVALLRDSACRGAAVRALLAAGEGSLDALLDALDETNEASEEQIRILRLLGRVRGPRSIAPLLERLNARDPTMRHTAMVSLSSCQFAADAENREAVEAQLVREVRFGAWLLSSLAELGGTFHDILPKTLASELDRCRERLLLLLGFLYKGQAVSRARSRYWTGSKQEQAIALELLDSTISTSHKELVFPLLEGQAPAPSLRRIPEVHRPMALTATERLIEILESGHGLPPDSWVRACALYCVAIAPGVEYYEAVNEALSSTNPALVEAALLASWKIHPKAFERRAAKIPLAEHPRVVALTSQISKTENVMDGSITIEKVIILKSVGIFSSTPSDVLLQVANALEEAHLDAGEVLFRQGDMGTSMYVVVEGRVRVHIGEQTIVVLGEREIVGELAALDPEPRSASVTAVEPTRLFRIEQETLLELMVDQPEIVRGVIRELAARIRKTTARDSQTTSE